MMQHHSPRLWAGKQFAHAVICDKVGKERRNFFNSVKSYLVHTVLAKQYQAYDRLLGLFTNLTISCIHLSNIIIDYSFKNISFFEKILGIFLSS